MSQKLKNKDIERIKNQRENGFGFKSIARKLNKSAATIHKYAREVQISESGMKNMEKRKKLAQKKFIQNFAKEKRIKKLQINKEAVRIIAHCLFDGSVCIAKRGDYRISYTNSSMKEISQFVKDFSKSFEIQPTAFKTIKGKGLNWYEVCFCSKRAYIDLHRYMPVYSTSSKNSILPKWILALPEDLKIEFLRAFWCDEGCIASDGKIHGKSKSRRIIEQIASLHKSLGIDCTIWKDNVSKNFAVYVKKKSSNVEKFSKIGFGNGVITRGRYIGESKQNLFLNIYK